MTIAAYVLFEPNTNSYYFGSSDDVDKRIAQHYSDLRAGRHHCAPLQRLWGQYGRLDSFQYPCTSRDEAYETEQALIAANEGTANLLNVGRHVRGGDNLTRNPRREEIIASRTETQNRRYEEMGSETRREKWGRSGENNPMFGRSHDDQARLRISQAQATPETAARLASYKETESYRSAISKAASRRTGEKNTFFGKIHSEESKERIRQAKLGNKPSNAMKVCVNGITYDSVREACDKVGISYPTMIKRLKGDDPNYSFVS